MKGKSLQMVLLLSVIGIIATSATFVAAESGESTYEKPMAPRYSETCAHGHNSFDCKPPAYRVDITDLQERVASLEKRMSKP